VSFKIAPYNPHAFRAFGTGLRSTGSHGESTPSNSADGHGDFTVCMGNPRLSMTIEIATPPEAFRFESLCDLYEQYLALLVSREHRCPRGIQVIFEPYHFFHLVKLRKGYQTEFKMSTEKEAILATKNGFGGYEIDLKRAEKLSWLPELINKPHEIYEYEQRRTADEVFIKEYQKSGSPFKVLLVLLC
jgi:hypothetical protein